MAEVCRLEQRVRVAEEDSKVLRVVPVNVNEPTSELASPTAVTEKANTKRGTLVTCICNREAAAATRD